MSDRFKNGQIIKAEDLNSLTDGTSSKQYRIGINEDGTDGDKMLKIYKSNITDESPTTTAYPSGGYSINKLSSGIQFNNLFYASSGLDNKIYRLYSSSLVVDKVNEGTGIINSLYTNGASLFAVGSDKIYTSSSTGVWNTFTIGNSITEIYDIVYFKGYFYICCDSKIMRAVSVSGTQSSWSTVASVTGNVKKIVIHKESSTGQEYLVAIKTGTQNSILYSNDGNTWYNSNISYTPNCLISSNINENYSLLIGTDVGILTGVNVSSLVMNKIDNVDKNIKDIITFNNHSYTITPQNILYVLESHDGTWNVLKSAILNTLGDYKFMTYNGELFVSEGITQDNVYRINLKSEYIIESNFDGNISINPNGYKIFSVSKNNIKLNKQIYIPIIDDLNNPDQIKSSLFIGYTGNEDYLALTTNGLPVYGITNAYKYNVSNFSTQLRLGDVNEIFSINESTSNGNIGDYILYKKVLTLDTDGNLLIDSYNMGSEVRVGIMNSNLGGINGSGYLYIEKSPSLSGTFSPKIKSKCTSTIPTMTIESLISDTEDFTAVTIVGKSLTNTSLETANIFNVMTDKNIFTVNKNKTTVSSTEFEFYSIRGNSKFVVKRADNNVMLDIEFGGVYFPHSFNQPVDSTNLPLYIDSNGLIGTISSTRESKTNILDIGDTSWIYNLKPRKYNFREKDSEGNYLETFRPQIEWGLIYEEVESINNDLLVANTDGSPLSVSYNKLIIPLLAQIQSLNQRIQALEALQK